MAHPGRELVELAKQAGGTLVTKKGHHETWEVEGKKYNIATAGTRPTHIMTEIGKALRGIIQRHEASQREQKPPPLPTPTKDYREIRTARRVLRFGWVSRLAKDSLETDIKSHEEKNGYSKKNSEH